MARTFRDFVVECEMYPHSKEHYDLLKKGCEIRLMQQYLEDQEFMLDNSYIIGDDTLTFTEGYFHESVDEDSIQAITEGFMDNVKGFLAKAQQVLWKALNTFMNFLRKIWNRFDKGNTDAQNILAQLRKEAWSEALVDSVKEVIDNALNASGEFIPYPKQPYTSKLGIKLDHADTSPEFAEFQATLAAAFSNGKVIADVSRTGDPSTVGAVPVDIIKSATKSFTTWSNEGIKAAKTALETAWKSCASKGMEIVVDTKKLNETIQDLNNIVASLHQSKAVYDNDTTTPRTPSTVSDADANTFLTEVVNSIGKTTAVYSGFVAFRNMVIAQCRDVITGTSYSKLETEK